jgi:hypothetical protein
MAVTQSTSGGTASINSPPNIAVQPRVDANIYGGLEEANQPYQSPASIGGDSKFYAMRDEIPAGNATDKNQRTNVVYTNYNYSAAAAVKDIHGQITSGGAMTTHTLLNATSGGAATNADDAHNTWVYGRGGSETTNSYDTLYA